MKLAISNSGSNRFSIPSHFVPNEFTLRALDNFNHSDKSSLPRLFSSHDTAMILCQTKARENTTKCDRSEANPESIESISKLPCQEELNFILQKQ